MKNFIILGLLALLLFSVSAALSLWLNQSGTSTDDKSGEKDKDKGKKPGDKEKDKDKEAPEPRTSPKTDLGTGPDSAAILRDQQDKIKLRSAQMELVLRDLQDARASTETLLRQVTAELKTATAKTGDLEVLAKQLEAKKLDYNAAERQNIIKMAAWYDAMAPESSAPILKQMADNGNMDTAVKILAQMKERQVAAIFAALNDPSLSAQLLTRMQAYKAPTAAPPPSPLPPTVGGAPAKTP